MCRRHTGYEARRSGVLWINYDHVGIFDACRNLEHAAAEWQVGEYSFRNLQKTQHLQTSFFPLLSRLQVLTF